MRELEVNIDGIIDGLSEFETQSKTAISRYADIAAKKLEEDAKKNAPWKDQSGKDIETIKGGKQWKGDKCNIYITGNEDYYPSLELCNDKKYAILKPTIDKLSPQILKGMSNLFGK
ncbi:hypothetical protein EXN65_13115 [Clostridium botulinum]|uniref:HK97 gp10 family phage protein n=2 Tax=Clostridium botulinum TaxID=1491 RepID=A0A846HTY1_CLOBO|nr:hypothetical protein [Clostridium botulinum]ACQ52844.1 conserved hypothetical protein [Clostridium botulinum Ba4 str. 657]AJE09316.1 hypothetical protein T259_1066 [Clostridium botulinum CDC_1436]AXG93358.1 hypothetical protein AGE29_17180 [Clostridium botulinum]EDT87088.1 conserved hypothetical protein [Clostridium botulinum Bf]MBY6881343.1 hypothetical protein [Clostridium botulinum]